MKKRNSTEKLISLLINRSTILEFTKLLFSFYLCNHSSNTLDTFLYCSYCHLGQVPMYCSSRNKSNYIFSYDNNRSRQIRFILGLSRVGLMTPAAFLASSNYLFSDLRDEDFGMYKCISKNSIAETDGSITLNSESVGHSLKHLASTSSNAPQRLQLKLHRARVNRDS